MKVVIAGDLFPQKCNMDLFEQGNVNALFGEKLLEYFKTADLRVCNLEGALTDSTREINKSGPCISAAPDSAKGIAALGIDCASIANNHIMDYGIEGYRSTLEALNKYGIRAVGCGEDEVLARKPAVFEASGLKIGVYSCAEYEFTIAGENQPGANAFDALYVLDDIAALRQVSDYVIVLYHGGKEFYRYPVPYVQKRCRRMVEKGADIVLCQHSHCVGCHERWGAGEILYGQGNFIFHREDDVYRHTGLLVGIDINGGKCVIDYLPVVRVKTGVRFAEESEKQRILDEFEERSRQIGQEGFVQKQYQEFADKLLWQYYNISAGRLSLIPRMLYKLGIKNIYRGGVYSKPHRLAMLNNLRCEAHRDVFAQGLLDEILEDEGRS